MNSLIKILKKIIYWASVIMPVIDGIKTAAQCVETGIQQGKVDVQETKIRNNEIKFNDANSNDTAIGCSVNYDAKLYRGDDAK